MCVPRIRKSLSRRGGRLLAGLAFLCLGALPAAAQDQAHRITLHNDTAAEVVELRVAPAGSNVWGVDLIGAEPIMGRQAKMLMFGRADDPCTVDLAVTLRPGGRTVVRDQNACDPTFIGAATFSAPKPAPKPASSPAATAGPLIPPPANAPLKTSAPAATTPPAVDP